MMYRSTPHTTTGVSPTEMSFGRCIRTKLPQLQEFSDEDEVRESESERKEKGKVCANCKRKAHESEIQKATRYSTEAQGVTGSSPNQVFREFVHVSPGITSEDKPVEYKSSDDTTTTKMTTV
ncbi:unnamed protein product [Pocillopora meandrina]|uniref:Uncharacterized protein n=1 Tax=Pocillopora meandrina TaxID=46732 RepID=A0AAU9VRR6_9CNID|nr:unnamed protein product [Pocillopora meandrina]